MHAFALIGRILLERKMKMKMKMMKFRSVAFWVVIAIAIAFREAAAAEAQAPAPTPPTTDPTTSPPAPSSSNDNNKNLELDQMHKTCKATHDYDLCISTLQADPRDFYSDVKGFAYQMITVTNNKAMETQEEIKGQLNKDDTVPPEKVKDPKVSMGPQIRRRFLICNDMYELAIEYYLSAALGSIRLSSFVDAKRECNDSIHLLHNCAIQLTNGTSPGQGFANLFDQDSILDRIKMETSLINLSLDILNTL
ncbi:uncharacterized protein LOC122080686 [Macadamia integrifolia]|uniref:uncharacterized protein LOC122080686 n=1 Tax=Macadamia integrifolia TaxID=60698 RepID=UPI001C4F82BC|nr:uncharacterized protein LOC122080686 [Macadamia integrifolia]